VEEKKTSMMHRSIDLGWNVSPLNKGETHVGTDGIDIKLIGYPADEKMMKQVFAKMALAVTGNDINRVLPEELAEELMKGGLNQGLESFSFNFEISGLSRQVTHELVRTRKATFSQQSMRHTNMGDNFNVRCPQTINEDQKNLDMNGPQVRRKYPYLSALVEYDLEAQGGDSSTLNSREVFNVAMEIAREAYAFLKDADIPYQDCRMVCPIATETYIIASYPINEFFATYAYRACRMFLWEIQFIFNRMREEVLKVFPWMEPYIKVTCEKTKRCMYQGLEDTKHDCEFPWREDRVYKPNLELIGLKGKAYGTKA
jgi:flavin-dependent thymidylate synthase